MFVCHSDLSKVSELKMSYVDAAVVAAATYVNKEQLNVSS